MTVREDNGYFCDGINSMVIVLVNENGRWGIGATYNGPDLVSENITIWQPGKEYLYGFIAASPESIPQTVRVNCNYDNEKQINVYTTTLAEYVQNTIQNECGNWGYHSEALKALCVASTCHVWYYHLCGFYASKGYDIQCKVDGQGIVNYHPNTSVQLCVRQAYSGAAGFYIIADLSLGNNLHFSTPYNAWCSSNPGRGQMNEAKANQLANLGYTWREIVHYFFDNSGYNLGENPNDNVGIVHIDWVQI